MPRPAVSLLVRVTAPLLLLLACCSRPPAEERPAALSAGRLPAATAAANVLVPGETSPLRDWMKSNASPALSAANFDKLRSVFDRIGGVAPQDHDFASWGAIARDGRNAAAAQDVEGVRRACKACHEAHRSAYKSRFRARPMETPIPLEPGNEHPRSP